MIFFVSLIVYIVILLLLSICWFGVIMMVFGPSEPGITFLLSLISIQLFMQTVDRIRKHKNWLHT